MLPRIVLECGIRGRISDSTCVNAPLDNALFHALSCFMNPSQHNFCNLQYIPTSPPTPQTASQTLSPSLYLTSPANTIKSLALPSNSSLISRFVPPSPPPYCRDANISRCLPIAVIVHNRRGPMLRATTGERELNAVAEARIVGIEAWAFKGRRFIDWMIWDAC